MHSNINSNTDTVIQELLTRISHDQDKVDQKIKELIKPVNNSLQTCLNLISQNGSITISSVIKSVILSGLLSEIKHLNDSISTYIKDEGINPQFIKINWLIHVNKDIFIKNEMFLDMISSFVDNKKTMIRKSNSNSKSLGLNKLKK